MGKRDIAAGFCRNGGSVLGVICLPGIVFIKPVCQTGEMSNACDVKYSLSAQPEFMDGEGRFDGDFETERRSRPYLVCGNGAAAGGQAATGHRWPTMATVGQRWPAMAGGNDRLSAERQPRDGRDGALNVQAQTLKPGSCLWRMWFGFAFVPVFSLKSLFHIHLYLLHGITSVEFCLRQLLWPIY